MEIRLPHKIFFVVAVLFVLFTTFIVPLKTTSGRVEAKASGRFELVEKEDFGGFTVLLIKDNVSGVCYMNSGTTSSNTTLQVRCN
jgi:hypothetical protein